MSRSLDQVSSQAGGTTHDGTSHLGYAKTNCRCGQTLGGRAGHGSASSRQRGARHARRHQLVVRLVGCGPDRLGVEDCNLLESARCVADEVEPSLPHGLDVLVIVVVAILPPHGRLELHGGSNPNATELVAKLLLGHAEKPLLHVGGSCRSVLLEDATLVEWNIHLQDVASTVAQLPRNLSLGRPLANACRVSSRYVLLGSNVVSSANQPT